MFFSYNKSALAGLSAAETISRMSIIKEKMLDIFHFSLVMLIVKFSSHNWKLFLHNIHGFTLIIFVNSKAFETVEREFSQVVPYKTIFC